MPDTDRFLFYIADDLLLERGEFDSCEFLIRAGFLDEDEHRAWLAGRHVALQSLLLCDVDEVVEALGAIHNYLRKQGLTTEPHDSASDASTRLGSKRPFAQSCCLRFVPGNPQRDLFQDSALTVAEHEIATALGKHEKGAAREALERLQALGGDGVSGFHVLIEAIEDREPSAAERLTEIERTVVPLATKRLGAQARGYLAPLWRSLARRLIDSAFVPTTPRLHASYAYAQAAEWRRTIEVVEKEPEWRRHFELMVRSAEAHARLSTRDRARQIWSQLCWSHPDETAKVVAIAPGDPLLARRWREFSDLDPELPVQDFPSWLLMADLRQREYVPANLAPDDGHGRAYAVMYRLVQNHDDVQASAAVGAHSKDLLKHFLARRRSD